MTDSNLPSARVTHVTTNHQPFDSRVFLKECTSLASAGYVVSLVVPHTEAEVRNNVSILPIPHPASRLDRFLRSGWQALRAALATKAQIYHLHDPDLLPVGWVLKAMGKCVIYDAHEDRPKQVLSKEWIPPALRPFVATATRIFESISASLFDQVVAATPAIADTFPSHKTTLVQNFPIIGELQAAEARAYDGRPNQVIFVGGMTAIRGVKEFVDAMEQVPERLGATLVLVGTFDSSSFEAEVRMSSGWDKAQHVGWQDRDSVARFLGSSRVGLVTYLPEPNHLAAQPNKLFEYMSAGIPVVASDFPLWRSLIEEAKCGMLVDPSHPGQIAEAITWLLDNPEEAAAMGSRGQDAVMNRLNWDTQSRNLLKLYAKLAG